MLKKILSIAVIAASALVSLAQTPLPLNPAVKHGTLPNGLNYYILHNEEPKERANFYIAQKVGSTLETPEQLGLAHFLEHMAFNGTKNFPGKNMLNYLQAKGIRFGADINAYTSFDETVYNIDNVPTTDKALMDSVLLAIHDWSGSILLEEDEINAERGVIEEEWRMLNTGFQRMWETILPTIYQEYQYQQMPIGKMEIVRNFSPKALRDYYHKWYRPDQQGIVIVGDFNVDEMEQKVIKLFSTIPMPENAEPRTYPTISDNKEPIYAYYADKEMQFPMVMVFFKSEKTPREMRNTVEGYVSEQAIEVLISDMINNRLDEFSKKPECKYAQAGVNFGDFLMSGTKSAFSLQVIAKDDLKTAYEQALGIVAQACKTGFMQSELVRSRDQLLSQYEKAYNERNNTKTSALGKELCSHFVDNDPAPGIETEYKLMQQMLPMLPVQAINQMVSEVLTPENQVIVVAEPTKDGGMKVVTKEEMVGSLQNALNAQYEAYVDEVITDPLINKAPKAGKITSEKAGEFGTTVFTLSNGAKVIVKPTDFKQDEIIMDAYMEGGKRAYASADAANVLLVGDMYDTAKIGNFDQVKLQKYLAGKNVSLGYVVGNTVNEFEGKSTVKDLPTFMELLYASFTEVSADETAYNTQMDQAKAMLRNMENNPEFVFRNTVSSTTYGDNPMFQPVTVKLLEAGNYAREMELYKEAVANAADFTFIFTGNVDMATFKPLVETYIASLPSKGKKSTMTEKSSIKPVSGKVDNVFKQPMQAPSTMIMTNANGSNLPYNIENTVKVSLVGDILSNIYTETLREEEGGSYSPYAYASLNPYTGLWSLISVVQTNSDMQDKMIKRSFEETMKLLNEGAKEVDFNKTREAMMKQYEINVRSNSYWANNILAFERGFDNITGHKAAIENLTLADFNKFMKSLYNGQNFIKVVMEGVPETK